MEVLAVCGVRSRGVAVNVWHATSCRLMYGVVDHGVQVVAVTISPEIDCYRREALCELEEEDVILEVGVRAHTHMCMCL